MNLNVDDLTYAVATLYGEARGESYEGKVAVAKVILNRVKDPRWPRTIKEVVLQRFQFSCWNANDPNRETLLKLVAAKDPEDFPGDLKALRECAAAFVEALTNTNDPTGGSNHYLNPKLADPSWARGKPFIKIGNHNFLKL